MKFSILAKMRRFIRFFSSKQNIQPPPVMTEIVTRQLKLLLWYVTGEHIGLFFITIFLIKHLGFVFYHAAAAVLFALLSRFINGRNFYPFYWLTFLQASVQTCILYSFYGDTFSVELYFFLLIPIASYALLLPFRSNRRRSIFIMTASLFCGLGIIYFALLPYFYPMPIKFNFTVFMVLKIYYIVAAFGLIVLETYFFVRRMVITLLDAEESKSQLSIRANFDALTGLYNRYEISRFLAGAFSNYSRYGIPLSVCMGDIDNFKQINDTYGHSTGDFVLKTVSQLMNNNIRKSMDFLGRWGGEEFLLVMPVAQRVCFERVEILRQLIQNTEFEFGGKRISVTLTFGVAAASKDTLTPEALVDLADKMLYEGKRAGRNRTIAAPEISLQQTQDLS